jgi:lysophospholipase L1-like esterase
MHAKTAFLNIITVIIFVCLGLVILEIGVRWIVPKSYWQFHDFTSDWQLDKVLGWVQKPRLDTTGVTDYGWTVRFQTNEDGLTPGSAQRHKQANKIRIMLFGDSTVLGRSVPQDKTVSAQLEQLLKSKGIDAEVINAGVQGYGTDQSLLLMERLLPLYNPEVVIYGLCQNDFTENQSSQAHEQAKPLFKITKTGEAEMVPCVLKDEIYSGGSGLRKWIQHIALYRLLQPGVLKVRMMIERWNNPNKFAGDSLDELYYKPEALEIIDWKLFSYLLKRMKKVADEKQVYFLFYAHPALQEVFQPYISNIEKSFDLKSGTYDKYAVENQLRRLAQEEGIVFIPMIDWFLKHRSEGPFHLLPRDPHCNQNGYRLIAEKLAGSCPQLVLKNGPASR